MTFVLGQMKEADTPASLTSDLRGIDLLHRLNTPAARKALEALAAGAAGARVTLEAAAALKRGRPEQDR